MSWTDDPVRDAANYDAEREKILEQLPLCNECNERIQDEYYFEVRGWTICPECMEGHKKWNLDF